MYYFFLVIVYAAFCQLVLLQIKVKVKVKAACWCTIVWLYLFAYSLACMYINSFQFLIV